jgi:hypothetical protein
MTEKDQQTINYIINNLVQKGYAEKVEQNLINFQQQNNTQVQIQTQDKQSINHDNTKNKES